MKTLKAFFTALFAICLTATAIANNKNTLSNTDNVMMVRTEITEAGDISLRLAAADDSKINISLKNEAGDVVWFEKLKGENTFCKVFDLDNIPSGNYFFSIKKETTVIHKPFSKNLNKITLSPTPDFFEITPSTRKGVMAVDYGKGQSLDISYVNNTSERVKINLLNDHDARVFTTIVAPYATMNTALFVDQLPNGTYRLEASNGAVTTCIISVKDGQVTILNKTPRA